MPRATEVHDDWIREAVIARANALGMSAGAISMQAGGKVTRQHVYKYLMGRATMGSAKLQHVLRVLGLQLVETVTPDRGPDHPDG
jgi:DNA-binding phage protein